MQNCGFDSKRSKNHGKSPSETPFQPFCFTLIRGAFSLGGVLAPLMCSSTLTQFSAFGFLGQDLQRLHASDVQGQLPGTPRCSRFLSLLSVALLIFLGAAKSYSWTQNSVSWICYHVDGVSLDDLGRTKSRITESFNCLNPVSVISEGGEQHVYWQESCPQVC